MKNTKTLKEAYAFLGLTLVFSYFVFWGPLALFKIPTISFVSDVKGPTWAIALYLVGGFVPSLLAIFLTWKKEGVSGLRLLGRRIIQFKLGWRWYAFTFLVVIIGTAVRNLSELNPESLEYKLLAAGVRLQPAAFRLLMAAAAVSSGVICWTFLPGVPALILGAIVGYLPYAWLGEKVKSRGREIDRLMPVAVGRIAAGLLAGGSIQEVLQKTGETLNIEGPNPLTPEFLLTAAELRSKERQQTFRNLAARSPSVSLSNLAYLLEGYSESGGGKYTEALLQTSQRIQQILVARNRSVAKAADALLSARIIPLVLVVVFFFLTRDPLIRDSLLAFPVQVVIGAGIGMMATGYFIMRSIITEAV